VVFGEGCVGWGEDDGAGDFVAGWHFRWCCLLWCWEVLFLCADESFCMVCV
jgi:hypothetical protein